MSRNDAFDPTLPSTLASRHKAGFARPRSVSGSINASSRIATAGDAQTSIDVHVWWPTPSKNASSTLARAPLFRDAANVKQKLSIRTSTAQIRSSEPSHEAIFERASFGFRHGGNSWLREKPSKARLNAPSSSVGPLGQWKRAILIFRENASLSIFGEANSLAHTVYCDALSSSDVRSVDDSLFGRPHVLFIRPKPPRVRTEVSITTRKQEAALQQERAHGTEPIFIQFNSQQELQYLRTLLHIYTIPEIYGSPASIDAGGTHRFFRQLDITISDAKSIMPKWPAELAEPLTDTAPSFPSPSFGSHSLPHPNSPTSTTSVGGASTNSGEPHRSLSHQLACLRLDDQDDSPASEHLTEDAMSASSRASSRPSSRPNSRLLHNSKPSVSGIRAHQDLDDYAGSGSSRPGSRAASLHDAPPQPVNEPSSKVEPFSGPLSGQSGASRFASNPTPASEATAPSFGMACRASAQQRRDDKDRYEKARFDRYCRIRVDGELVARTSLSQSDNSAFAVDKFKLDDVGDAKSLTIEVLHPTQKTNTSLTGSPSAVSKFILLGIVEIPIATLRRNEEIEGRFPIWSTSTFPSLSQQQQQPAPFAINEDDDARPPTRFHRGVVGELCVSIRLQEGAVMPLSTYDEVYRKIHSDDDFIQVFRELATTMREDLLVSQLTRICAASGTMAERISHFIELESASWGEKMEPELLFRANTLLSRSIDHFQRLLTLSWLDDCLGPTVRKICQDPHVPSRPDTAASISSAGSVGGDDAPFDFSTSIRSPPSFPDNIIETIPDGPITINALRKLSESMWQNIYRQRHSCPPDLRTVLHKVRTKVNERYRGTKSTRPGIQGVGAFVFLRLFCAALNSPQLYGLAPCQPSRSASRKLLLLSKVLLALASKKTSFDKDKDWELVPLNDLLHTYSSAYDDYISVISTEPPTSAPSQWLGMRIDGDSALQAAALHRLDSLSRLHRESIPRPPYMLDQPQALAAFVSFVTDTAHEYEKVDLSPSAAAMPHHDASSVGSNTGSSKNGQSEAARIKQKTHEFVQICRHIEQAAGRCIEQAGFDPRPIPWEQLQRSAMSQHHGDTTRPCDDQGDASVASFSSSTCSFGTVTVGDDAQDTSDALPRSGSVRMRSRRATVSAATAWFRATDPAKTLELSIDHTDSDFDGGSPSSARRKSIGVVSRTSRKTLQVTTETRVPQFSFNMVGARRRGSEMRDSRSGITRQTTDGVGARLLYRVTHVRHGDVEDDHGSDDELRQAYRLLRADEEAAALAASQISVAFGRVAMDEVTKAADTSVSPALGDAAESELGLQTVGTLMETDDGSAFEAVHSLRTMASGASPESAVSRRSEQSAKAVRVAALQSGPTWSPTPARKLGQATQRAAAASAAAGSNQASSLAAMVRGARGSLTSGPSKQPVRSKTDEHADEADEADEVETCPRQSSDQTASNVARNYSLPRSAVGRKKANDGQHARESSDGFESAIEDAYAQTRASMPPSTSMSVCIAPSTVSAALATRVGNDDTQATGAAAHVHAKKKKWWKP